MYVGLRHVRAGLRRERRVGVGEHVLLLLLLQLLLHVLLLHELRARAHCSLPCLLLCRRDGILTSRYHVVAAGDARGR